MHGEATPELGQQISGMSTHYIGDNPDRVVLGKCEGDEDGYIGEARGHGGIYYDTGDRNWDAIDLGLSESDRNGLDWPINEHSSEAKWRTMWAESNTFLTPTGIRRWKRWPLDRAVIFCDGGRFLD